MKIYVVTSLIESQDEGAEVFVIGSAKTKQKAYLIMSEALQNSKEMFEENEIDYNIAVYEDNNSNTIIIETIDDEEEYNGMERIEYNIFESEVE